MTPLGPEDIRDAQVWGAIFLTLVFSIGVGIGAYFF